jgi:amino acid adenylation domain-containing protein
VDRTGTELIPQQWEGFRLSAQQERVLGLVSAGAAGRTVAGVRLVGQIDSDVLRQAAHDVASVHESLRSAYRSVLGENSTRLMVIEEEPRIRVSESTGGDPESAARVREEAQADGYDGALHIVQFTHSDRSRSLLLSAPRMSMDGTSAEIFFRDLHRAYGARLNGTRWTRDDVVQYADFAQWQADEGAPTPEQKERAAERDAQLASLPPMRLPLELRSGETGDEVEELTLPASLARSLREVGGGCRGGLRTVLLTGWLVGLWHATGRPERVAVSTTMSGRALRELATSIGNFECAAPVLAGISEETTLGGLLETVGQDLASFEDASQAAIEPVTRRTTGIPGFAFADVVEFPALPALNFSDLWVTPSRDASKVFLRVQGVGDEFCVTLCCRAAGLAAGGAEALLTCLRAALEALAGGNGSTTVSALPMLGEDVAHALLAASNTTQPRVRSAAHWHRQVERTAQRTPDAVALRTDTRTWTYRDFDTAANRLAHELAARGAAPGDLVGLCLERSDLAVVAMLAIAKVGAGYVPVDPQLPRRRRSAIAEMVGFRHAIATDDTATEVPAECDVVLLDTDLTVCAQRSSMRPETETADDHPAYVLFTSGSTGTPKAVLVGHGQLAAYLDGVAERLALVGAVDSVALGTLGTDLGNTALFLPLMSGGRLRIVDPCTAADAQQLGELLAAESYDLLKMTPSHLEAVIAVAEDPAALMPHQALVLGGEPLAWGAYNVMETLLGDCRLYNHYGPSETTVGVLCGQVTDNALATLSSTVPLGRTMRHARAYLLDPHLWPVPIGVPGELWIGGSSVCQGYLEGAADQERRRFVDDPFASIPGARMYRTGDRARLLPDLRFEFLGRLDRQIKVRGFRVEIGEIEAVMRQHPRVLDSIVVVSGESMAARLIGYLIDTEGGRGSADWLTEFLAERLPEYMVPSHIVALEAFPLTSAGKVDASVLPEPSSYDVRSTPFVEPRTPTERAVADIQAQLLLLKQVGADDDFFEMGGHSLLATQLVAKLRNRFTVNLKLRHLFERPAVGELAALIDELLEKKVEEMS